MSLEFYVLAGPIFPEPEHLRQSMADPIKAMNTVGIGAIVGLAAGGLILHFNGPFWLMGPVTILLVWLIVAKRHARNH